MYVQIDITIPQKFEEILFDFADQNGISCFSSPVLLETNTGNEEQIYYSGLCTVSFILYITNSQTHNQYNNQNQHTKLQHCNNEIITSNITINHPYSNSINNKITTQPQEFINNIRDFCKNKNIEILQISEKNYSDNTNWMENYKNSFQPIEISKKNIIIPPWYKEKFTKDKNKDKTIIVIEPGMAFGTGTHETTKLCLTILESINCRNRICIDIGTGSGILTFYLILQGASKVLAIEKDQIATQNFIKNAKLNNISNEQYQLICVNFEDFEYNKFCLSNKLYNHQNSQQTNKNTSYLGFNHFDIIVANLTSDLIIQFLPKIKKLANLNADIIISGINTTNSHQVIQSIVSNNLKIVNHLYENEWHAFHLCKTKC